MIRLTRFNQQQVVVNLSVIACVESDPDTRLTLTNGERLHVRESVAEVVALAEAFLRRIHQSGVQTAPGNDEKLGV